MLLLSSLLHLKLDKVHLPEQLKQEMQLGVIFQFNDYLLH